MNHDRPPGSDEDVRLAAAAWFARMRSDATDFDHKAYETWLQQDPRHQAAIDRMKGHFRRSAVFKPSSDRAPPPWRAPMLILLPVAAMAILFYRTGLPDAYSSSNTFAASSSKRSRVDSTGDQPRRILLADGSAVSLDAGSAVRSEIEAVRREVTLLKGRARFTVMHDPRRPFTVSAQGSRILAVGTIFDVAIRPDRSVDVLLIRGRVRVSSMVPSGAVAPAPIFLEPRQHAVVMPNGGMATDLLSEDLGGMDHTIDGGMQSFDHVLLSDIVREANPGSPTKLQLGPEIDQIQVSGRFQLGDTPRLAATLAKGLDLSISQMASGDLMLDRKTPANEMTGHTVR